MEINGYNINSEIQRGPVTTVYDAYHQSLSRRVLLKVLNTQWSKEKDLIDRFRREAKICARLDHPNIVKIFDFNQTDELFFISMEYIEGSTLESLISDRLAITFPKIIDITLQILTGLAFAHQQGIIHRDIKPSNIMISSEGSVKITDFGLAVVSDLPGITVQDQTAGSPAYMSPEQVMGQELDQRSDLFSLGICLYKLCTQNSPFEADTMGATIHNILSENVKNVRDINPVIPDWFSDLIDSLLTKQREDRPDSANSIINIIHSNFRSENNAAEAEQWTTTDLENIQNVTHSNPAQSDPRSHAKIFLWIFPILLMLSYLIFSQSKDDSSEISLEKSGMEDIQNLPFSDSITISSSDKDLLVSRINTEAKSDFAKAPAKVKSEPLNAKESFPDSSSVNTILDKSKLFIIAKPWAEVFIDSVFHDETPLHQSIALEPGNYYVELRNPHYQTFSKFYELYPAQSETLFVELVPNIGFLNIKVLPWAKVFVDGKYQETSPIENPIELAAGEHIITLTNPNYTSINDTIRVIPGKILEKRFNFKQ